MVKLPRRCNQLCFKMKNQVHPLLCVYVRNKNNYTTFIFSFIFGTRNESHDVVDYLYCIIPRWLRQKQQSPTGIYICIYIIKVHMYNMKVLDSLEKITILFPWGVEKSSLYGNTKIPCNTAPYPNTMTIPV